MPQYTGSFTIDVPGGVVSGSMTGSFTPSPPSPPAPTVTAVVVSANGTTLTITLSRASTGHTGFALKRSGSSLGLTYVSGDGGTSYVYTVGATVYSGQTVTLDYTAGDVTTGTPLADFTAAAVTNNSTQSAFATVRLDFGSSNAQAGATLWPSAAYADTPGYGWVAANGYPQYPNTDRGGAAATANPNFFRKGDEDGSCRIFAFKVTPGSGPYDIRIYFYDPNGFGNGTFSLCDADNTGNSQYVTANNADGPDTATITITDTNADGLIRFRIGGGSDSCGVGGTSGQWMINGIDVALAGGLPTAWN